MERNDDIEIKIVKGKLTKVLKMLSPEEQEQVLKAMTKNEYNNLPPDAFKNALSALIQETPQRIFDEFKNHKTMLTFQASLFSYTLLLISYLEKKGELTLTCRKGEK